MPQSNEPKAQVEPPTQAQEDEASTSEELEDDEVEDNDEIAPFVNSVFDAPLDPLADDSSQGSNQG